MILKKSCPSCNAKGMSILDAFKIADGKDIHCDSCGAVLCANKGVVKLLNFLSLLLIPMLYIPVMLLTNFLASIILSPVLAYLIVRALGLLITPMVKREELSK